METALEDPRLQFLHWFTVKFANEFECIPGSLFYDVALATNNWGKLLRPRQYPVARYLCRACGELNIGPSVRNNQVSWRCGTCNLNGWVEDSDLADLEVSQPETRTTWNMDQVYWLQPEKPNRPPSLNAEDILDAAPYADFYVYDSERFPGIFLVPSGPTLDVYRDYFTPLYILMGFRYHERSANWPAVNEYARSLGYPSLLKQLEKQSWVTSNSKRPQATSKARGKDETVGQVYRP